MVIGIPGTGTAGVIATILAFKHGHIVGGVLSVIACTGWVIQTVGHAFYYQKVRRLYLMTWGPFLRITDVGIPQPSRTYAGES
jgi:hypothetical protein